MIYILLSMLSVFGSIYAADKVESRSCKIVLNETDAYQAGLSTRRINSLIEAYMQGRFAASEKSNSLKYDDYETAAGCQKNWTFEDSVTKIHEDLMAAFNKINWAINEWELFDFHLLLSYMNKKEQITYLKNLDEKAKEDIQILRLYDFLKCINMDHADRETIKSIEAHRHALAEAVTLGNALPVLEACKKPLHSAAFTPLNMAIAIIINDIESDKDNVLLSNKSRVFC